MPKAEVVPQDYVQALMWLNLAAEQDKDAVKNRDDLAKRATPEQIAEAQRLAPRVDRSVREAEE